MLLATGKVPKVGVFPPAFWPTTQLIRPGRCNIYNELLIRLGRSEIGAHAHSGGTVPPMPLPMKHRSIGGQVNSVGPHVVTQERGCHMGLGALQRESTATTAVSSEMAARPGDSAAMEVPRSWSID